MIADMPKSSNGELPIYNKFLKFCLPGADMLRSVFGAYGLSDQDIVALSGAHTIVSLLTIVLPFPSGVKI